MRMEFLTRYHAHLICVESYVMIPSINGTAVCARHHTQTQAAAAVERMYVCNLF